MDVASGTGDLAIAMARRLPSARILGIDLSEGMLEIGRRKAAEAVPDAAVSFMTGDCLDLPLADASADVVTALYRWVSASPMRIMAFWCADLCVGMIWAFRVWENMGQLLEMSWAAMSASRSMESRISSSLDSPRMRGKPPHSMARTNPPP